MTTREAPHCSLLRADAPAIAGHHFLSHYQCLPHGLSPLPANSHTAHPTSPLPEASCTLYLSLSRPLPPSLIPSLFLPFQGPASHTLCYLCLECLLSRQHPRALSRHAVPSSQVPQELPRQAWLLWPPRGGVSRTHTILRGGCFPTNYTRTREGQQVRKGLAPRSEVQPMVIPQCERRSVHCSPMDTHPTPAYVPQMHLQSSAPHLHLRYFIPGSFAAPTRP